MDKMQKSMENLVNILLDTTTQATETKTFEDLDTYLGTINSLTTNIKRLYEIGIPFSKVVPQSKDGENNADEPTN